MIPSVGYVRVSTEKQVTEAQVAEVEAFCSRKGLDLSTYGVLREAEVTEVTDDKKRVRGVSAFKKTLNQRPEGAKLIRLVETRKVKAVVVAKVDRIFRRCSDAHLWAERLAKLKCKLYCVDEGGEAIDVSTTSGLITFGVKVLFAQVEPMQTSDRVKTTNRYRRQNGLRVGPVIPYGFRLGPDGKKLMEEQAEQDVINYIKKLRADACTFRRIVTMLQASGFPAPKGGKTWDKKTAWRIIREARPERVIPMDSGEVRYNE